MLKQLLTQAGRPSSKAPKDKFSLENLRYLYNQLVKYPVVDSSNANRIVEVLRSIAELMIWGDQHNPLFFDYFAEKNIITNFARIIAQKSAEPKVKTQVIQTLSILIQNTDSEQAVFYLLSNNYINDLIVSKFDFTDDDLLAHYISFLKTLSFKLNTRTILFFYNDKANDFPLYVEALKFFNHPESMVRAAVRTLSLNIYKVDDERMRRFIYDRTCLPYFCNLVWFLKDQTLSMSRLIEQPGAAPTTSRLDEMVENIIDFMYYLQDILSLNIDRMSGILTDQLLSHFILPVLIGSLVARYDPQKMDKAKISSKPPVAAAASSSTTPSTSSAAASSSSSSSSSSSAPASAALGKQVGLVSSPPQREATIQARLALYMLAQVFLCFSHYGLINSIVTALLHPTPPVICETIVRTPIKYPFRHPRLPLTGIIFPKSLHVAPVVEVVTEAVATSPRRGGNGKVDLRDSDDKEPTTTAPDLLFSPRDEDEGERKGGEELNTGTTNTNSTATTTAASSKADSTSESALDFFSTSTSVSAGGADSRSSSPAPSTPSRPPSAAPSPVPQLVDGEHAGLLDMFSGIAPTPTPASPTATKPPTSKPATTPPATPPTGSASTATPSSSSLSSSSSSSSLSAAAPSSSSSSTSTSTSAARSSSGAPPSPSTPTSTLSLAASSSANSLTSLRKSLTKSASAATEKLTNILTSSKPLGVGLLDAPLGVFCLGEVLYVLDSGHHRVQLFDKTGKAGKRFGSKGSGDGQLMECEGLCVHPSSRHLFVSDHNNHRVTVFDGKGSFVRSFGSEGSGPTQFNHPTGLAISSGTGLLYVCDSWNHRVVVYDSEGRFVRVIGGKKGDGDGELSEPAHLAVCQSRLDSTQDRVYVTDYGNDRVQVFDAEGKLLLKFGRTGKERGEFTGPVGLTIHHESVYIVDRGNHRVQIFDLQGGYLRSVGKKGNGGGELNEPNGVAVGNDGRLFIADSKNNRVMTFIPTTSSQTNNHSGNQPFTAAQGHQTAADAPGSITTSVDAASSSSATSTLASSSSSSSSGGGPSAGLLSPPPQPGAALPASTLSNSHSTDDFKHELPVDQNNRARSSLPEMKVVYNPERSSPTYAQAAQHNRNKQALLFALGSQDERVGFGAMGVVLSLMSNEVVDKELLLQCGVCPQTLRRQEKLLKALTKEAAKELAVDLLFDAEPEAAAKQPQDSSPQQPPPSSSSGDLLDTLRWTEETKGKEKEKEKGTEVDLMAFHASPSYPTSPATNRKPDSSDEDSSGEEESASSASSSEDDEAEEEEEAPQRRKGSSAEAEPAAAAVEALDFFQGAATSPKSNGASSAPTSAKESSTSSAASPAPSTLDLLSSFSSSPRAQVSVVLADGATINGVASGAASLAKPVPERGQSNDPLLHQKPILAPIHSAPHPAAALFHIPTEAAGEAQQLTQTQTPQTPIDSPSFDYSHDIVSKLFPLPKPKQPPVRLTTLQLLASLLKELTFNPTSPHPSLAPAHIAQLRDTNSAFAEELKLRFKTPQQGNFALDVVEEESAALAQTVYPKALVASTRNLLLIEDRQLPGVGLEWRRGGNEWEKTRKALQGFLYLRSLRYQLMKKKDPFYPLSPHAAEGQVKVGDELSISHLVYVHVTVAHHPKPALLVIDADSLLLLSPSPSDPAKAKVDTLIPLKAQEPFAVKGRPDQINILLRSGLRPHPGARKVKAGPHVTVEGGAGGGLTVGQLSGQKPVWVVGVMCQGGGEVAVMLRKNLEQGRIRCRKALMNRMYKAFEQRQEEESTSIPAIKAGDGTAASPPIVPFSILNLLGDRQADIEEEDS